MRRVLTAAVLAPLALALVLFGPKWLITLVVAAVAMLAGWEFLSLAERCGAKPPRFAVMAALAVLFVGNYQWPDQTLILLSGLCLSLFACCTFRTPVERVLIDSCSSVFALIYVGLTLLALPTLREQSNGPSLVIFLLFVVWSGDITALYVGRLWGKKKLAPAISPNKTWVGAVGSVLGSMLVTVGLYWLSLQLVQWNFTKLSFADEAWWWWLAMAVVVNVAAQVGDLAESALKRSAGMKDSGSLLPGHGGVLDRIDALLIAAPVLWWAQVIR
ncbi:MAG TPA: phosphatidate cytidylyltransferase [Terracidiphilus sp.]|jgi:phosphatidate cytidylyltransferase|nr:phosphatidate cytidylyltransferase [Terracidiphilus sp.]